MPKASFTRVVHDRVWLWAVAGKVYPVLVCLRGRRSGAGGAGNLCNEEKIKRYADCFYASTKQLTVDS